MTHQRWFGVEFWRYKNEYNAPRYERQCWLWNDGRWLHKHFIRIGGWVYCFAWYAKRGKPHDMRRCYNG